jgi:hypothetical protein
VVRLRCTLVRGERVGEREDERKRFLLG